MQSYVAFSICGILLTDQKTSDFGFQIFGLRMFNL
jgi:hypothetical protein